MSIFYHNDDPLLNRGLTPNIPMYNDQMQNEITPLSNAYAQLYRQQLLNEYQQKNKTQQKDWLAELDEKMTNLDSDTVERLNGNSEFINLNQDIQKDVQREIMSLVKFQLNASEDVQNKVKRQIEIINETTNEVKSTERKNMLELNDYMKNYSNMTFDEYRRMKNGEDTQAESFENKGKKLKLL